MDQTPFSSESSHQSPIHTDFDESLYSPDNTQPKKRKTPSLYWDTFNPIEELVDGVVVQYAICKYCNFKYDLAKRSSQGAGTLLKHRNKCQALHVSTHDSTSQTQLNVGASGQISNFMYDGKKSKEGLAKLIASAELPLNFGENKHFVKYVKSYLQPQFGGVGRILLRKTVLQMWIEEKMRLKQTFASHFGAISLTCDMWSGLNDQSYICITAHHIDSQNWTLQKNIIAFRCVPFPHTAQAIYSQICSVFNEYEISTKVFSITFDNSLANTKATKLFKLHYKPSYSDQLLHIKCVYHIINLIAQDGIKFIKGKEDFDFMKNLKYVINYIDSSFVRVQSWREYLKGKGLKVRMLKQDIKTRWNSTYLMLKSVEGYEEPLQHWWITNGDASCELNEYHFGNAAIFCEFLGSCFCCTNMISRVYYPTTCHALDCLFIMAYSFKDIRACGVFNDMVNEMVPKFVKYWKKVPPIYYLASIVDPRCKLEVTMDIVEAIFNMLGEPCPTSRQAVSTFLRKTFDDYVAKYSSSASFSTPPPFPQGPTLSSGFQATMDALARLKFKSRATQEMQPVENFELTIYLSTDEIFENPEGLDILNWWKTRAVRYPILSIMARDLLTPPVSTVASESCFSASGRVLTEKRSRMSPDILEALICSKDYSDGEERLQESVNELSEEFAQITTTRAEASSSSAQIQTDDYDENVNSYYYYHG